MKGIRSSVKAVIVRDGAVLLIRKRGNSGDYFVFPGGGQEKFETMTTALVRECREEIGVEVVVRDLFFVREYIARNHEFAVSDPATHQNEFYFLCDIVDGVPANGPAMDQGQIGVEWISVAALPSHPVYPLSLRGEIAARSKIYHGDTN